MSEPRTFATVSEAASFGRAHGLRGVAVSIVQLPTADQPAIVRADVSIGADTRYSAHGSAPSIELAEGRAIVRALGLALGVTIGKEGASA